MAKAKFERTKPHVNIGTIGHIDHGKTTFSDNLLFGAGMMSEELAGKACVLDFHEDEKARGITIDSANVRTLAHWIPAARQVLDDFVALQGYVNTRLIEGLKDVEDYELVAGDGTGQLVRVDTEPVRPPPTRRETRRFRTGID